MTPHRRPRRGCGSNAPLLSLLLLLQFAAAASSSSSFSLDFFPGPGHGHGDIAQLALSGGANATPSAISMASPGAQVQYRSPIVFPSPPARGFSTYFSFALPAEAVAGIHPQQPTLAFFLTPSRAPTPPALAVVFAAQQIRVDIAGRTALQSHHPHQQSPSTATTRRLHSWTAYNATSATLHVRLSAARLSNPDADLPLLSYPLDLSPVLRRGPILAGFRTSSGNCSLFSWAFRVTHGAPYRMHSQPLNPTDLLATPPPDRAPDRRYTPWGRGWGAAMSLLLAAACGAMVTFLVLFLWYSVASRRPVAPVEYPMHSSDVVYEKIVLVGVKDDAATANNDSGGNK